MTSPARFDAELPRGSKAKTRTLRWKAQGFSQLLPGRGSARIARSANIPAIIDYWSSTRLRAGQCLASVLTWQVEFVWVGRHNVYTRAWRTVAQAPGALVVAGGDGTINAVASACVAANRPLDIVPSGTFNYITRNLGLPTEVALAVSAIINGHIRRVE